MQQENGLIRCPSCTAQAAKATLLSFLLPLTPPPLKIFASLRRGVDYLFVCATRFEEALTGWLRKKTAMENASITNSSELDLLIHGNSSSEQEPRRLPKGLTQTLRTLCQWIDAHQEQEFSTDELANEVNSPRVSCRKYLIWLVNCHILFTSIHYGVTGRPVYRHRVQPNITLY